MLRSSLLLLPAKSHADVPSVLVSPQALPRFWIFMYRATPLSYYISGIMSVGLSGVKIACQSRDFATIPKIALGETCTSYLKNYTLTIRNPDDTANCMICRYSDTNELLAGYGIHFSERWRNWGITVAYNCINIGLAFLLWWMVKVPKKARKT